LDVIRTIADLRRRLADEPAIALVPTMGNLHAGHVTLVDIARARGGCVAASVFVNRLQFDPGGDFDRYPRTLERDCEMLRAAGTHVVFAPDEGEMYPEAQEVVVAPPRVAESLEGVHRPGHFQGVVTVVTKLFNAFRPHVAVFGKKDYQQLQVIMALERQLNFGIRIVAGETVREPDGLAMSSRNGYLSKGERAEAIRLNRNLTRIKAAVEKGALDFRALETSAEQDLANAGWKVDYVAIRRRAGLEMPGATDSELVVLGAARLGKTRLIDNLEISAPLSLGRGAGGEGQ
jgi:pantoate--beta-alanine ligase